MEKKWKPVCGGAVIFGVHTAVVVRVVARSSSYFHTGEGGSFKCFNAADSATSPLLSAWSMKKRITKADRKLRDRARDALEKVRDGDDVKARLAVCELLLAADRVLGEVDPATQAALRTEREARERERGGTQPEVASEVGELLDAARVALRDGHQLVGREQRDTRLLLRVCEADAQLAQRERAVVARYSTRQHRPYLNHGATMAFRTRGSGMAGFYSLGF